MTFLQTGKSKSWENYRRMFDVSEEARFSQQIFTIQLTMGFSL